MNPVPFFETIEQELRFLRSKVKLTQSNASVQPENCADCRLILKGIRDDLKPYVLALKQHELDELYKGGK